MGFDFSRITFIGGGLMNTSIALGAKDAGLAPELVLYDNHSDSLVALDSVLEREDGVYASNNCEDALDGADLVILGTPIDSFGTVTRKISPFLDDNTVITHIGSVMEKPSQMIRESLPEHLQCRFLASHPATGRAGGGALAAERTMMQGANLVLSSEEADIDVSEKLEQFWGMLGTKIIRRPPDVHDREFATISHLQHVLSFTLTALGKGMNGTAVSEDYLNGGNLIRDPTRIAQASESMWLPIFNYNRDAIVESAERFSTHWKGLMHLLENSGFNGGELYAKLREAHDFAGPLHKSCPRERLMSDIHDFEGDKNDISDIFAHHSFARRVGFPVFLGAVISLNAKDMGESLSIQISDTANPSFLDATRPAASHAGLQMALVSENREEILPVIDEYKKRLDRTIKAIGERDQEYLRALMAQVGEIRSQMPPHRKTGTDEPLRQEYIAD